MNDSRLLRDSGWPRRASHSHSESQMSGFPSPGAKGVRVLQKRCFHRYPGFSQPCTADCGKTHRSQDQVYMGRPRGATKLLVEDSLALDLRDLARAGVFRSSTGTPCNCSWRDAAGVDLHTINFRLEGGLGRGLFLRIMGSQVAGGRLLSQRIQLGTLQCATAGTGTYFSAWQTRPWPLWP